MGNCCSDQAGGRAAVGGASSHNPNAPNEAIDKFLKSRGYHGLFSQIEVSFFFNLLYYLLFLSLFFQIHFHYLYYISLLNLIYTVS